MPSPFPGMDPYLESQGFWPDFHASFVPYCRDALNEALPEPYEARLEEQFRLVEQPDPEGRMARPDVAVVRRHGPAGGGGPGASGVATLALEPVTVPLPTVLAEVRDVWIDILRRPDRRLVAVIEVLSPTNKAGSGFSDYLVKRRSLISQEIHLVEIDLLLGGLRLPMGRPLPPGDYYALVARKERRPECAVYAWTVHDPLPTIPIPLLPPDPDVPLDLAAVFATAYERGRYARSLDYAAPLELPLRPEERTWAEAQARGGRPGPPDGTQERARR